MRSGTSVTSNPPDTEAPDEAVEQEAAEPPHPLTDYAEAVAAAVGGDAEITFDTIKVTVPATDWVQALTVARDEFDLVLFSFLSAIDWVNETAVGDPPSEEVEERFEVLATVSDVTEGKRVTFSTRLDHDQPALASLVDVYAGADWHEREAHEMFGIDFIGHPDLSNLYLPESFLGRPLLKSFPLLSREVKPWPGTVDVEAMPEKEEEADEEPGDEDEDSDGEDSDGEESAGEESAGEESQ
jgi:NADH-quinone oxidoreductase subunit C